jgi:hypothetical protein
LKDPVVSIRRTAPYAPNFVLSQPKIVLHFSLGVPLQVSYPPPYTLTREKWNFIVRRPNPPPRSPAEPGQIQPSTINFYELSTLNPQLSTPPNPEP